MSNTTTWNLARKRESPSGDIELRHELESVEGVSIVSVTGDNRAQIEATPEGIERVRARLSASFHVEAVAPRSTSL
jgi:hypothetical protein